MTDRNYHGKFRGTVTASTDPYSRGRVRAQITLGGDPVEVWAEACLPYAGDKNGMYAIPPVGAGVWVEFEQGDLDKPIWSGCWWKDGELQDAIGGVSLTLLPVVIQSTGMHRLILSGGNGDAVVIETVRGEQGPRIVLTDSSVRISCGSIMSIEITEAEVKINDDALVIR
jgi:hypothetical protein